MTRALGLFLLAIGVFACVIGAIGTIVAIGELNRGGAGMLIPFVLIDAFGIGMLILAVVVLRNAKPIGAATAASSAGGYVPNAGVEQELDGTPYTVLYTPPVKGKHAKPSVLTVSTAVACNGEFQMSIETWFDQMCKRFGIATEVQTGDDKFDNECYIRSDTPDFTAAYLTDTLKRIAILDLRNFGFREVILDNGKLEAKWIGFDPATNDRPELREEVAARLLVLARNLPVHQPEFANRTGSQRKFWQRALWCFLIAFALTAFSLFKFVPISTTELLLHAAPALLTWPVFAYLSAYLLSGTSRSHNAWSGLMLGSCLMFPIGCAGTISLLNGLLDTAPDTTHDALITEKYTSRSKNTTKYHVRCTSWRNPGETISFQISSSEYGTIAPGRSKLLVTTKPGWLGVEWEKSRHVDAQPRP